MTQLKNQSELVTGFIEELTRINKYYNCFSINISYTFYWTESLVRNSTFPAFYTTSQGEIKTLFVDIRFKWLTIRGLTAKILWGMKNKLWMFCQPLFFQFFAQNSLDFKVFCRINKLICWVHLEGLVIVLQLMLMSQLHLTTQRHNSLLDDQRYLKLRTRRHRLTKNFFFESKKSYFFFNLRLLWEILN